MHEGEIQLVIEDDETGDTIAEIGNIDIEALRSEANAHPGSIAQVIIHQIDAARDTKWFIHKYEVWQESGGPEEGGWWYTQGQPVRDWEVIEFPAEDLAYEQCRILNDQEHLRRESEEKYSFSSVLARESTHYTYTVESTSSPTEYPVARPHYE
jgi:hypothetical protein